ncbi:MAG: carbohydrate binding domain-containing protein [Spirochaetes bacterium]|nr:carbohydrate binding domain-containing protein [Spirochaetota bacterium]
MKTTLPLLCATVAFIPMYLLPQPTASPLKNGDFSGELSGWDAFGNPRAFTVSNELGNRFVRYEMGSGMKRENIHLDQKLDLAADRSYTFRFRYRTRGDLQPVMALATTNWIPVATEILAPSTEWKNASFTFLQETPQPLRLQWFAGARGQRGQAFEGICDLSAVTCESAPAQSAMEFEIRLDAEKPLRRLPNRFTGVNTLFWLETAEDLADGKIAAQLAEGGVGYLRYPGGTAGQNFDWKTMQVVDVKRYPFGPKAGETWLDSTGFARLAGRVGSGAFLVLDLASMYLQENEPSEARIEQQVEKARAWALYLRQQGLTPACWELGNEHYLPDVHNGHVRLTAKTYAMLCRRFIDALRSVDPAARFGLCGPEHGGFAQMGARDKEEKTGVPWWPTLLKAVGSDVDRIILHHYFAQMDQVPGRGPYGADFTDWRREYLAWCRESKREPRPYEIGYTEWGGKDYQDPLGYALFMHEALCGFARAGADFAIQWPLRRFAGGWENSLLFRGQEPTAGFRVLAAWGRDASGADTYFPEGAPAAASIAVFRKNGQWSLLAGNKSRRTPLTILCPRPYPGKGAWRVESLVLNASGAPNRDEIRVVVSPRDLVLARWERK